MTIKRSLLWATALNILHLGYFVLSVYFEVFPRSWSFMLTCSLPFMTAFSICGKHCEASVAIAANVLAFLAGVLQWWVVVLIFRFIAKRLKQKSVQSGD